MASEKVLQRMFDFVASENNDINYADIPFKKCNGKKQGKNPEADCIFSINEDHDQYFCIELQDGSEKSLEKKKYQLVAYEAMNVDQRGCKFSFGLIIGLHSRCFYLIESKSELIIDAWEYVISGKLKETPSLAYKDKTYKKLVDRSIIVHKLHFDDGDIDTDQINYNAVKKVYNVFKDFDSQKIFLL